MTSVNNIKFNGKVEKQQASLQPNNSANWALLQQKPDVLDLSTKKTPVNKSKVKQAVEEISSRITQVFSGNSDKSTTPRRYYLTKRLYRYYF